MKPAFEIAQVVARFGRRLPTLKSPSQGPKSGAIPGQVLPPHCHLPARQASLGGLAGRSPTTASLTLGKMLSVLPIRIMPMAHEKRKWHWRVWSSSGGSACIFCRRIFGRYAILACWPMPVKTKCWLRPWPLWLTKNSSFLHGLSENRSPNNASLARLLINAPAATKARWLPSKRWRLTKTPLYTSGLCSITDPIWQHAPALALPCPAAGI